MEKTSLAFPKRWEERNSKRLAQDGDLLNSKPTQQPFSKESNSMHTVAFLFLPVKQC